MNNIRNRVDALYATIAKANSELEEIRKKECPHDKGTQAVNYAWAPGHTFPANICLLCDYPLQNGFEPEQLTSNNTEIICNN